MRSAAGIRQWHLKCCDHPQLKKNGSQEALVGSRSRGSAASKFEANKMQLAKQQVRVKLRPSDDWRILLLVFPLMPIPAPCESHTRVPSS